MNKFAIGILFLGIFLTPAFVSAQFGGFSTYDASVNEGDIDVSLTPESPGAFQNVRLRLDSNTVDLNRYMIRWTINGSEVLSGTGERSYQVTTGGYGSSTQIGITINLDGLTIQKSLVLSPQDATLLWEVIDAYVPPFYKGKKLPTPESEIKISGIPNFQTSNSLKINDAVYLWDRNGNRILGVGGYAKDSIIIKQNRLRSSESITTTLSDVSGNRQAVKTVQIPVVNPEIHWYAKNPFGFRLLRSIDRGVRITQGDLTLVAEPYYFSTRQNTRDLVYGWKMNNEMLYLDPQTAQRELLVRNPGTTGQTSFTLTATHPQTFLQEASRLINVYFQQPN